MAAVKVAVVGAGQIGSRHIQALYQMSRPVNIQAVDPSEEALKKTSARLNDSKFANTNVRSIQFFSDVSELDNDLDVVIVATNADVRKTVIENVLADKKVKYMILEKVLFQDFESFETIDRLLAQHNVQAWVNCPIRTNRFFRMLKQTLHQNEPIQYDVIGGNLGIGCNSIHHVDLFSYLSGESDVSFMTDHLDKSVIPSKRKGFIEFTGTLYGCTKNNNLFRFTSFRSGQAPLMIHISTPYRRHIIRLNESVAWTANEQEHWVWKQENFSYLYQSELTHKYVEQILDTGTSYLPTYAHSWKLHKPLLGALLHHYNKITGEVNEKCPIT